MPVLGISWTEFMCVNLHTWLAKEESEAGKMSLGRKAE